MAGQPARLDGVAAEDRGGGRSDSLRRVDRHA
jgi:hypothetical protein